MRKPLTNHAPFNPFNIKRGKKLPTASGIATYLQTNDKIAPLLPTIRRNASLQKECEAVLPSMFTSCEILQLNEEQLTLSTPNAALASKLKQQLPKLQAHLQQRGWQINAIRIKVQVKPSTTRIVPNKQLNLSKQAVLAFKSLENTLEKSKQNEHLLAALERLVRRHAPRD